MPLALTLVLALASLAAWIGLLLVRQPASGTVHLLLAVGVTLMIRWWALRA